MPSSSSSSLPFLVLLLLLSAAASAPAAAAAPPPSNGSTVYDLLPEFGLPPGLLPDSVTSFSLASDGSFVVDLAGPCYVDFEYLVYYEPRVTGVVKYGGIGSLKGIQVRRFLIWFDVDAIKVDLPPSDYIYFEVGWITRKLRVDQFETVHSCRSNRSLLLLDRAIAAAAEWIRFPNPC
ncbi:hypothetical protein ACMD2_10954 [Ananas comosus]|uniref:DUF538 domain-containing protein n=1 Tax=Ananas comosus TaxID=4615 RepID=A0A199UH60_ANACO|nr:hypothetical protein ACMD2_10954 [Ananas comosus]